ncbi:acyl-CoA synthetase (AMP-forming)/AMP-acid ligase II [Novosphingobium kunmingense]|uniref:Acyl-CoA synthetase (AMP-forming)/AMP-acid ligase II n=1 Tax=Novosphingobium kunmingense TaxID=1211806 RepID=A0A2N0H607_9SPHN|nr:long-chain fatty acid--CoA ligase [Novosphingobium kunmingense]PKB14352.1 acyl-CoA synthetase (AMP-forming)/AMP-acid ligase II [Novosphingobium kunmingense]
MALITEKLRAIMAIDPERAEVDFEGRDYTWGQLAQAVAAIERSLDAMGLPGDARVGVMLRNRPGHIAAILALLSTDRCLVSLNPALPDDKLFADIGGLGLPAIVLDEGDIMRPGIDQALADAGTAVIVIGPRLEGVRLLDGRERPAGAIETSPGVAIEMLTSGTTGTPKRVPLTRAAFEASFAGFTKYERGREFADKPQLRSGVTVVNNPLTHIGGIYGLIGALLSGRKIALLEKFTVEDWVAAIRRNRPKVAGAVPSALRMLVEADVDREALSSLSALISGTAPLSPDLVDAVLAKYGIPVLSNYGATEFAGAVAGWSLDDFRAHWQDKRGAAGRVHGNVAARVIDPESGAVVAPGQEGLLEIKGDQLGQAYRLDGDAWLRTTDRVVLDEAGFLFVKGRADNAIIRGGFKVHPDDVVQALHQHPAIREAAVIGVADARLGEVPAAAVILKDGARKPEPDELKAFLKDRLIAYQVPVHFRFVADLPRTPSMKPSAPGLKALFEEQAR